MPKLIGGRYGLSSKDFDPAMAKAVFDELKKPDPKHGFTVGINDDVSHTSLAVESSFDIESPHDVRALFYGLGADGTVGANKNSVKILADDAGRYAQGYFVYDSKKSVVDDLTPALRIKPIAHPYLQSPQLCGLQVRLLCSSRTCSRRGTEPPFLSTVLTGTMWSGTNCHATCSSS